MCNHTSTWVLGVQLRAYMACFTDSHLPSPYMDFKKLQENIVIVQFPKNFFFVASKVCIGAVATLASPLVLFLSIIFMTQFLLL